MNTHSYLRAYLAGVFLPTLVLPLMLTGFVTVRLVLALPIPIERFIIFPMAVVPSVFGLWNMLYLRSHMRTHLPIGVHGALLPLLLMPTGALLARCLGILQIGAHGITWFQAYEIPYAFFVVAFAATLAGYYLIWKYVVGFMNRLLAIA